MLKFNESSLAEALTTKFTGVDVVSYGKPRDAFSLGIHIPHFTSGYGGNYEMVHTNVPEGVMIAVGNIEQLDFKNFEELKKQLSTIDIYPFGHSGDFSSQSTEKLRADFNAKSVIDNVVQPQENIAGAKILTPQGLGDNYNKLVTHLVNELHIFKDPKSNGMLVPESKEQCAEIVIGLLDGLSKTERFTRLDAPAKAYQVEMLVTVDKYSSAGQKSGSIDYLLSNNEKILIVRQEKDGLKITPLDVDMLGKTYVTKDGEPLDKRGKVDALDLFSEVRDIESAKDNERSEVEKILASGRGGRRSGDVNQK